MSSDIGWFDVTCIGDVAVDFVYRVSHLPGKDEKVDACYIGQYIGGTSCNTARALTQLGRSVKFLTVIGKDKYGDFVRHQLNKADINLQVIQLEGIKTSTTQILISDEGEKAILLFAPISNPEKIEDRFRSIVLPKTKVIFSTGSLPGFERVITGQAPVVISLEKPTLQKSTKPYNWAIKHAHTLVLDQHSFHFIFNKEVTLESIESVFAHPSFSINYLIVTLGQQGVIGYSQDPRETTHLKAHKIQPLDTTGAGDIFNAAFIHSFFFQKMSFRDALAFSNAIAAASCEESGTMLSQKAIRRGEGLYQQKGGVRS